MSRINRWVMVAILMVAMVISGNGMVEAIDPPLGSMKILSGSLAGQPIGPGSTTIRVAIGESIIGTMVVEIANWHRPGALFPVGWTPTWGCSHADIYEPVTEHQPPGTAIYSIPVNLPAPPGSGNYYIFIAGSWQIGVDMLMSATLWTLPSPVWDDDNDVADWGETNYLLADLEGWALYNILTPDGYQLNTAPAAGIKVIVESGECGNHLEFYTTDQNCSTPKTEFAPGECMQIHAVWETTAPPEAGTYKAKGIIRKNLRTPYKGKKRKRTTYTVAP